MFSGSLRVEYAFLETLILANLRFGRFSRIQDPYVRYSISGSITINDPYSNVPSALPNGSTYTNFNNPGIVSGSSSGSAVAAAVSLVSRTSRVPRSLGPLNLPYFQSLNGSSQNEELWRSIGSYLPPANSFIFRISIFLQFIGWVDLNLF